MILNIRFSSDDCAFPVTLKWDTRHPWSSYVAVMTGLAQGMAGESTCEPLSITAWGGPLDGATLEHVPPGNESPR